jgi:hypothetical protein
MTPGQRRLANLRQNSGKKLSSVRKHLARRKGVGKGGGNKYGGATLEEKRKNRAASSAEKQSVPSLS